MSKANASAGTPAEPLPDPSPPPSHIGDEHWGKGGRYVKDPATGRRAPAPEQPDESQE